MYIGISTHAPLAGRDDSSALVGYTTDNFNPRAPCGARPGAMWRRWTMAELFQPTRPLRGATVALMPSTPTSTHFNPRAPCGARLRTLCGRMPTL